MVKREPMITGNGPEVVATVGLRPRDFFDIENPIVADLFMDIQFVWDLLAVLEDRIWRHVRSSTVVRGVVMDGAIVSPTGVFIDEGAVVEPGAFVQGPCFIGQDAEVRHGAYIRGNVMLLDRAVLGHASEAKNCVLLPDAKAPHFAYIGDSILGVGVNLGAGTKLSNLAITSVKDPITDRRPSLSVWYEGVRYDTGLTKFGSILGDASFTGCNAVLNPGTLVGPRSLVYANVSLPRGVYRPDSVFRLNQEIDPAGPV